MVLTFTKLHVLDPEITMDLLSVKKKQLKPPFLTGSISGHLIETMTCSASLGLDPIFCPTSVQIGE